MCRRLSRRGLRCGVTLHERAGNPDDANWESHSFLAPSSVSRARLTATLRLPNQQRANAQGEKQRDHSDQTPSVEQLRVPSTMMILQGGMDMGTAGADAPPAQPINDNTNPSHRRRQRPSRR